MTINIVKSPYIFTFSEFVSLHVHLKSVWIINFSGKDMTVS